MGYGRKGKLLPTRIVINQPTFSTRRNEPMVKWNPKYLTNSIWSGKRCFILGGGYSLENFNFKSLCGELTIGINKVFVKFSPTINYSMDWGFHQTITGPPNGEKDQATLQQKWKAYKGLKVFLSRNVAQDKELSKGIFVVRNAVQKDLTFDLQAPMFLGGNSGFGALMIAIALGANPIYLLGYDMCVDDKANRTHWHKGYVKHNIRSTASVLKEYRKEFNAYAGKIRAQNISVVNVNSSSKLDCFDKLPITALPLILRAEMVEGL